MATTDPAGDEERHKILVEWNETAASYPRDKCLHHLFEDQVNRTPEAIAVVAGEETLSYRELNRRSDHLAGYLRSLGAGAEVPVGLHCDRTIGSLVGLLAILKAGGAYVPLPAGSPEKRYAAVVQDSGLRIVVAGHQNLEVPQTGPYQVVFADRAGLDTPPSAGPGAPGDARPENLACILYTSGSTGQPKGICVEHRGLVNLMTHRLTRQFDPAHFRVAALTAPLTFDASITQIFSPLFTGGTLVIARSIEELLVSPWYDRLTAFTGAATLITDLAARRRLPASARVVAVGGEPVPARLLEMVRDHPTAVRLDVLYGLTECSGYSTTATLFDRLAARNEPCRDHAPADDARELRVIGRPIANTQIYVLEDRLEPVAIGVAGELYIGGEGVTRGFLGDPAGTAKRFVANPFVAGGRMHRTGDLARWRPDGQLEFLGRIDEQVKLRGNRIELGEIEALLCTHAQVNACAVVLRDKEPASRQLVAYIVPREGMAPAELRRYLREGLPQYMVPSRFIMLPALPLSPSGKVDRRALPAPDDTHERPGGEEAAPRNEIEEQLVHAWSELLKVSRVGIHDDFFDLGGHSLLAVELFARIEKRFQRRLPMASLVRHGTVAAQAVLLAQPGEAEPAVLVVELRRGALGRLPLFLLPNLAGDHLSNRQLVQELGSETSVYGLQPRHTADCGHPSLSFEATVALYVQALREFQPRGPYSLAGHSYGGSLAYEVACELVKQGHQVDLLAIIDMRPRLRTVDRGLGRRVQTLLGRLQNLPFWVRDDALDGFPRRLLWSSGKHLRRLVRRWSGQHRSQTVVAKLEEVVHVAAMPAQVREQMASAFRAYQLYETSCYPGRVTLIRARTRSLLCPPEPDLGWGGLARGGVDLRIVPGYHHNILNRPFVEKVAIELNKALMARPEISRKESPALDRTGRLVGRRSVQPG